MGSGMGWGEAFPEPLVRTLTLDLPTKAGSSRTLTRSLTRGMTCQDLGLSKSAPGSHPADEARSRATTRTRPHASHHAPQTEAPLPAESAAAAAAAAAGTTAAVEAATLIGETVRPPSPPAVACVRGGTRCVSRSLVRARFSRRRDRMPPPPLTPATPDEQWLVAMRALDGALLES